MRLLNFLSITLAISSIEGMTHPNAFKQATLLHAIATKEIYQQAYHGDYSFANANSLLVNGLQRLRSAHLQKSAVPVQHLAVHNNNTTSLINTFPSARFHTYTTPSSSVSHGIGRITCNAERALQDAEWMTKSIGHIKQGNPCCDLRHLQLLRHHRYTMLLNETNAAITVLHKYAHFCSNIASASNTVCAIKLQRALNKLTISNPFLNKLLHKAIYGLQQATSDSSGRFRSLANTGTALAIINDFQAHAADWFKNEPIYYGPFTRTLNVFTSAFGYPNPNVIDPDYLVNVQCFEDACHYWHNINYKDPALYNLDMGWQFTAVEPVPHNQPFHQKLLNNPFNDTLLKLADLAAETEWQRIEDYARLIYNSPHCSPEFKQLYNEIFFATFTKQGIHKSLIKERDPFYQTIQKLPELPLHTMPLAHPVNDVLARRNHHYAILHTQIESPNITDQTEAFLYEWVDALEKNIRPSELNSRILSQLATDHPNPEMRQLYTATHANGLCNLLTYNVPATTIKMDDVIGLQRHQKERTLLFDLATAHIDCPADQAQVTASLHYLQKGLEAGPLATEFLTMARTGHEMLLTYPTDYTIAQLANYAQIPTDPTLHTVHHAALSFVVNHVCALHTDKTLTPEMRTLKQQELARVDAAYKAMINGNMQAHDYLDRALMKGQVNHTILHTGFDKQAALFRSLGMNRVAAQVASQQRLNSMLPKELVLHTFELTPQMSAILKEHNLSFEQYLKIYGTPEQQKLHLENLQILEVTHEMFRQRELQKTERIFNRFKGCIVETNDQAIACNHRGEIQYAALLTDFCWKMLDVTKQGLQLSVKLPLAIGRGSIAGIADKVGDLSQIVKDPIGAAKGLITSLGNLGQMGLELVDILDRRSYEIIFGNGSQTNLEVIAELNQDTKQAFQSLIAYAQKEGAIGLTEKTARFGTSCLLDIFLINKGSTLLKNIAKTATGAEMSEFLANFTAKAKSLSAPEVVTAEGLSVKVAHEAENILLKKASEIAKSVKSGSKSGEIAATVEHSASTVINEINQTSQAILKNGYYEVNGFKISEFYYKRLWEKGRHAPTLFAKDILKDAKKILPDLEKKGFFRYETQTWQKNWEMVYNPVTKEIWHLQPLS